MKRSRVRWLAKGSVLWLVVALACAGTLAGQKQKKKSGEQPAAGAEMQARLPDPQAIDAGISEMLGAWQVGNVEALHKHYSDDVIVVSGVWEPPVVGWKNYLQAYQRQRERLQSVRLDRSNTLIRVRGNIAWAAYQWDFGAVVDGKPSGARGHTTLVLEKRGDRWLIVHNHTSIVPESQPPAAPAKPGASSPGAGPQAQ